MVGAWHSGRTVVSMAVTAALGFVGLIATLSLPLSTYYDKLKFIHEQN